MASDELLKRIISELEQAKKPASFCTSGTFELEEPQITVKGIGPLTIPVRATDLRKLCNAAVQAPYGK